MESAVKEIINVLVYIVQIVPIGTNLNLVCLLWALRNGSFLESRGAVHRGPHSSKTHAIVTGLSALSAGQS